MSELDELMAQRKEIDRKIRELKNVGLFCGNAKWTCQHFPRGDEWTVFVRKSAQHLNEARNVSVIQYEDKQKALDELDLLIKDLQGLRELIVRKERTE